MIKVERTTVETVNAVIWDGSIESAKEIKSLFPRKDVVISVLNEGLVLRVGLDNVDIGKYVVAVSPGVAKIYDIHEITAAGWEIVE